MKKLLVAFAFALVLLMALACGPSDTSQLDDPAKANRLAWMITREYRGNPVRFELEHAGTQHRVHGKVYRIISGGSVRFSRGWGWGSPLVCHFTNPRELVNLSKGDKIVVTGVAAHVKGPRGREMFHMVDCKLDKDHTEDTQHEN